MKSITTISVSQNIKKKLAVKKILGDFKNWDEFLLSLLNKK